MRYRSSLMNALAEKWGFAESDDESVESAEETVAHKQEEPQPLTPVPGDGPSLEDLLRHYARAGIVGEEWNCVMQTMCAIDGISFGVEGPSGSGKTMLLDALLDILPSGSVYKAGLVSDVALFHDCDSVNRARFLYIPELQKALRSKGSPVVEIVKDMTEGKESVRRVTLPNRNGVESYALRKGLCVMYTLADENDFKKDAEMSRRVVRFRTDTSKEHVEEIMAREAAKRIGEAPDTGFARRIQKECSEEYLKQHIAYCMSQDIKVYDPFAPFARRCLPEDITISELKNYYRLVEACAKYKYKRHASVDGEMVTNLEDHFAVFMGYCVSIGKFKEPSLSDQGMFTLNDAIVSARSVLEKRMSAEGLDHWLKLQQGFGVDDPWVMENAEQYVLKSEKPFNYRILSDEEAEKQQKELLVMFG